MSFINCYYITDGISSLCELVSTSDIGCVNINYFQPPSILPQYQLIIYSKYFVYITLSCNLCDWYEWLGEGSCQLKYLKITISTKIEAVVTNHA